MVLSDTLFESILTKLEIAGIEPEKGECARYLLNALDIYVRASQDSAVILRGSTRSALCE